jgi:hypothetical protein
MASTLSIPLRLSPLRKRSMAQLVARAKDIGVTPEEYAKQLVEDGLALQQEAESMSIAQIMGAVRKGAGAVDETEVIKLVGKARTSRRRNTGHGKRL